MLACQIYIKHKKNFKALLKCSYTHFPEWNACMLSFTARSNATFIMNILHTLKPAFTMTFFHIYTGLTTMYVKVYISSTNFIWKWHLYKHLHSNSTKKKNLLWLYILNNYCFINEFLKMKLKTKNALYCSQLQKAHKQWMKLQ